MTRKELIREHAKKFTALKKLEATRLTQRLFALEAAINDLHTAKIRDLHNLVIVCDDLVTLILNQGGRDEKR